MRLCLTAVLVLATVSLLVAGESNKKADNEKLRAARIKLWGEDISFKEVLQSGPWFRITGFKRNRLGKIDEQEILEAIGVKSRRGAKWVFEKDDTFSYELHNKKYTRSIKGTYRVDGHVVRTDCTDQDGNKFVSVYPLDTKNSNRKILSLSFGEIVLVSKELLREPEK